jgi:hypothetical protein
MSPLSSQNSWPVELVELLVSISIGNDKGIALLSIEFVQLQGTGVSTHTHTRGSSSFDYELLGGLDVLKSGRNVVILVI